MRELDRYTKDRSVELGAFIVLMGYRLIMLYADGTVANARYEERITISVFRKNN